MTIEEILKTNELPTLSKTLYELIQLEKINSVSFNNDLKKIIEKDPLLSAQILREANSPLYGFSQKVRTIPHAISLLGFSRIRNLAFRFSIFDFLKKVNFKPKYGIIFNLILKKSLLIASVCNILTERMNFLNGEEMYVSGLMTNIGQILLFLHSP